MPFCIVRAIGDPLSRCLGAALHVQLTRLAYMCVYMYTFLCSRIQYVNAVQCSHVYSLPDSSSLELTSSRLVGDQSSGVARKACPSKFGNL